MRVLGGRGVAALIRDVNVTETDDSNADETSTHTRNENPHLTSPELRARIREQLKPIFFDDSAAILRKIESITHPLRNDLTLASFAHLRGGKLYGRDTKRMNAFREKKGSKP